MKDNLTKEEYLRFQLAIRVTQRNYDGTMPTPKQLKTIDRTVQYILNGLTEDEL